MSKTNSYSDIKKYIEKENYKLISDSYINNKSKLLIKHNTCKNIFEMSFHDFQRGRRCPKCRYKRMGKSRTKTTKWFKDKVKELTNENEYSVLGEYKSTHEKILLRHNLCNQEYYVQPNVFLNGRRCPYCKGDSKGIKIIKTFLEDNNIQYITEKTFENCVNINKLRYDIYIENINTCIEYDGEYHFKVANYFNNKYYNQKQLEKCKYNDNIKNEYCKNNNIKLIRIPYTEINNIESILTKELNL